MSDSDCEGVGGVGSADLRTGEQSRHHRLDLILRRTTGADDSLLDQRRSIFSDIDPGTSGAHQRDAAGMRQLQRRRGVLVDEDLLHCGSRRTKLVDDRLQLDREVNQAPGEWIA